MKLINWASLMAQMVKNPPAMQETWVRKIPWRKERLPTPVFWPVEFHGQRSLGGYLLIVHGKIKTQGKLHGYPNIMPRGPKINFDFHK